MGRVEMKREQHLSLQLAGRPPFNVLSAGKLRRLRLRGGLSLQKGIP